MRASRWETLGAWLRLWTPPRDVEVPPPPRPRTLFLGALAVLVVSGGAYAVIAPRIDEGKDRRSASEQRAFEARRLAQTERLRREGRPRRGSFPAGASRQEVLTALETAITRDAVARFERGELPGRVSDTRCEPAARRGDRLFDCLGKVRTIVGVDEDERYDAGTLGYPFRARVDFDRRRWAFCKVSPPPGEQIIPDPRYLVEVPPACRSGE